MKRPSKAALRQRLADMAAGAMGEYLHHDDDFFVNPDALARWICVARQVFGEHTHDYAFALHNLDEWTNPTSAADLIWRAWKEDE